MSLYRIVAAAVSLAVLVLSPTAGAQSPTLNGANFFVKCGVSHTSNDDPIVHPRRPGRSHAHTFFGNRSTDAFSTYASLREGRTTCRLKADTAAYWVPTLYVSGKEVRPRNVAVYYRMKTAESMRAFPRNLRIVAGDPGAAQPQSTDIISWSCSGTFHPVGNLRGVKPAHGSQRVPTCARGTSPQGRPIEPTLVLRINFPDCWDGRHLSGLDHMRYSEQGACPASHPALVPRLIFFLHYPTIGGPGVELASGGQYSAHGDFINTWDQRVLSRIVATCSKAGAKADCATKAAGGNKPQSAGP